VLVVTDQSTLRVSRQSGLAGTRQTEEDGNIPILTLVGRGVQSQDIVLDGHLVEQNREDTLLHFSGVLGTQDDHLLVGKVDGDRRGRGHTLGETVGREGTGVVDDIVGVEVLELRPSGTDEHVAHEQSMVGASADNTDIDPVSLVPAGKAINHVDSVAGVKVVDSTLAVDSPDLQIGEQTVTSYHVMGSPKCGETANSREPGNQEKRGKNATMEKISPKWQRMTRNLTMGL
jgi:hypothetical protein